MEVLCEVSQGSAICKARFLETYIFLWSILVYKLGRWRESRVSLNLEYFWLHLCIQYINICSQFIDELYCIEDVNSKGFTFSITVSVLNSLFIPNGDSLNDILAWFYNFDCYLLFKWFYINFSDSIVSS